MVYSLPCRLSQGSKQDEEARTATGNIADDWSQIQTKGTDPRTGSQVNLY